MAIKIIGWIPIIRIEVAKTRIEDIRIKAIRIRVRDIKTRFKAYTRIKTAYLATFRIKLNRVNTVIRIKIIS